MKLLKPLSIAMFFSIFMIGMANAQTAKKTTAKKPKKENVIPRFVEGRELTLADISFLKQMNGDKTKSMDATIDSKTYTVGQKLSADDTASIDKSIKTYVASHPKHTASASVIKTKGITDYSCVCYVDYFDYYYGCWMRSYYDCLCY